MSMRISSLALSLALTACGQHRGEAPPGDPLECDLAAVGKFAAICTMERKGSLIIVHQPDGSFRRFEVLSRAPGVALADGADELSFASDGPYFEVYVGTGPGQQVGYRLPLELKR